jgi:protein-tyrosine phosphatase
MLRDKGENEVVVENRRALGSVSVDYLNQTIDLINTNYGNVQNYLTEYFDLSPTDLKQLQQLYLD